MRVWSKSPVGRLLAAAIPLTVLVLWALASAGGYVKEYQMPAPWSVGMSLLEFLFAREDGFLVHSLATLKRVIAGFGIAVAIGVPVGLASGRSRLFCRIFDPTVQLLRSVPGISWLPLAILWFGIGDATSVFLISLAAFFPVYLNTAQGVNEVPAVWLRTGRMLGAKRSIIWKVLIPAAMPSIETGLRLAMGISWAYVVLGELTGVNFGLGAIIMDARVAGDPGKVIVGMICIAVLGRVSDLVLMRLLGLLPGHRRQVKASGC